RPPGARLSCPSLLPAPTQISTLSLHDALPIFGAHHHDAAAVLDLREQSLPSQLTRDIDRYCSIGSGVAKHSVIPFRARVSEAKRSEEHTSELQSRENLVCRLLLEKKNETEEII